MITTHLLLDPLFQKIMYCSQECSETPGSDLSLDHLPRVWGQCVYVVWPTRHCLTSSPLKIQVGSLPTFPLFILKLTNILESLRWGRGFCCCLFACCFHCWSSGSKISSVCLKGQGWIKDGLVQFELWKRFTRWDDFWRGLVIILDVVHVVLSAWFLWSD